MLIIRKMLIIETSYSFLYAWNWKKLHGEKFHYGNCMIRSFGQPDDIGENQKKTEKIKSDLKELLKPKIPLKIPETKKSGKR